MILDLDIGNSRIKWRLLDSNSRLQGEGAVSSLAQLIARLEATVGGLQRVRACSVSHPDVLDALDEWLARQRIPRCERATSRPALAGVSNAYQLAEQLGVDRWLAICAAYKLMGGACIVVDAGSAITLDYVHSDGQHRGGFIVPGLQLMKAALQRGTERVVFRTEHPAADLRPGTSTQEAVSHGVLFMMVGMIEKAHRVFSRESLSPVRLVLTGGDAELLGRHLRLDFRYVPDLVFRGIEIALP